MCAPPARRPLTRRALPLPSRPHRLTLLQRLASRGARVALASGRASGRASSRASSRASGGCLLR